MVLLPNKKLCVVLIFTDQTYEIKMLNIFYFEFIETEIKCVVYNLLVSVET